MIGDLRVRTKIALGVLSLLACGSSWAEGAGWFRRRATVATPTSATVPAPAPSPRGPIPTAASPTPTSFDPSPYPMLGTFYPSPYLMVRGNWPAGGGYSPLGLYGDQSMAVYGPLSPFRGYTAPVVTYTRGYDGRPVPVEGNSFSTPNRPDMTPVVYPTQSNYYYRIRGEPGDPPWWGTGTDWIDQN
jgi:hypothetical protein